MKYAIQCKNYNNVLSNQCVQEAYSGKQFYNCHVGIVVTNNYFTKHAKELANKNGILLWDRDELIKMINKINPKDEQPVNLVDNTYDDEFELDDSLYNEILNYAISEGEISTSRIQRKYRLGYNKASRIIDTLESNGIIGPANGPEPRKVLITK